MWINYAGPWNITQKDVDISFEYRIGGPKFPLLVSDMTDWGVPIRDCYRNVFMNQFMSDLLWDVLVDARV